MILDVCVSGCAFDDLHAAVAASAAGDTILVGPGDWSGEIRIPHDLAITSMAGPAATRLSAGLQVPVGVELTVAGLGIDPSGGVGIDVAGSLGGSRLRFTGPGVAIQGEGGTIAVTDSVLAGCDVSLRGGGAAFANVTVTDGLFDVTNATLGVESGRFDRATIRGRDSVLILSDLAMSGAGPLIDAVGGSLELDRCGVRGTVGPVGSVRLDGVAARVLQCGFAPGIDVVDGAAIAAARGDLVVFETAFVGGSADRGAAIYVSGGTLMVQSGRFRGGDARIGAAIYAKSASAVILDSSFRDGVAARGGAIAAVGGTLTLGRDWFCGAEAVERGGAVVADEGALLTVDGSAFLANRAGTGGAVAGGGAIQNSTFLGNLAENGAMVLDRGTIRTSIFARTPTGGAIVAGDAVAISYSAFFDNLPGDIDGGVRGDGLLFGVNPGFVAGTGGCDGLSAALAADSLLADAGPDDERDADGTRAGIGATAGAEPITGLDDVDGDGVIAAWDCDDADPAVRPGAVERCDDDNRDEDCDGFADDRDEGVIDVTARFVDADADGFGDASTRAGSGCAAGPGEAMNGDDCDDRDARSAPGRVEVAYDGVDQDCDGVDVTDVDGDGVAAVLAGGRDCDDERADVHPGADEVWYDGIDQDCDGNDADRDGDGHASVDFGGDDCDDDDAARFPGALDLVGIDLDCDGLPLAVWLTGGRACETTPGGGILAIAAALVLGLHRGRRDSPRADHPHREPVEGVRLVRRPR